MKRSAAFLLCFLMIIVAVGCKEENEKSSHSIDISYFADAGTLPDCKFKIGDSLPENDQLEKDGFVIFSDSSPAYISDGVFSFFFDGSAGEEKITKIAALDSCLGFELGSISIEITDALDEQKIGYTERNAAPGELFFLPAGADRSVIECKNLKNPLLFILEENALCAVLLG